MFDWIFILFDSLEELRKIIIVNKKSVPKISDEKKIINLNEILRTKNSIKGFQQFNNGLKRITIYWVNTCTQFGNKGYIFLNNMVSSLKTNFKNNWQKNVKLPVNFNWNEMDELF